MNVTLTRGVRLLFVIELHESWENGSFACCLSVAETWTSLAVYATVVRGLVDGSCLQISKQTVVFRFRIREGDSCLFSYFCVVGDLPEALEFAVVELRRRERIRQ